MRWLCTGVLLGGFLQMAVPGAALMQAGWRPRFTLRLSPALRSIFGLMGPTVLGSAVYLINLAVSRVIGLSLNDAAAALLNLATRLVELPIGVFAIAVSTVVFPLISAYAAKGDWANLARAYHKGMRLVLAINMPAAVGLAVLAAPIIRVLFQRGEFSAQDTASMAPVLMVFAAGLPFFAYTNLMLRAFYAQKDTRTPVRAAVLSFVVNVVLSVVLMGPLSTIGLALASNLAVVVQAVFLQRALTRRRVELGFGPMVRSVTKIGLASAVMGAVVAGGLAWSARFAGGALVEILRLAALVPVGGAVYVALVWFLQLEGREDLVAIVRRRRAAPPAPPLDS